MSIDNSNEGAFPVAASYTDENPEVLVRQGGLTKREYIATMALQGILSSAYKDTGRKDWEEIMVKNSISIADELLEQLSQESITHQNIKQQ